MWKTILAVCLFLVLGSNAATFSINSVSSCTNTTAAGFCVRWEQNGSVTQTTSCFPGNAEVFVLEEGIQKSKPMASLQLGDKVLGFDEGANVHSEFMGWLHKNPEAHGEFLLIETSTGKLMVSSHHNLALSDGSYVFAKELLGKTLYSGQTVKGVQNATGRGVYAPMTKAGNFFVKTSENQRTLAHCFANIRNPDFYKPVVTAIWQGWELVMGESEGSEIHPAAQWMMSAFKFLMEK